MKVVIQRVIKATVHINGLLKSSIENGLLVFAGFSDSDDRDDIAWMSNKIINLRIFDDESRVPNLSVKEIGGEILLVSQFTLHALTKKGNRPSYIKAAGPGKAMPLYELLIKQIQEGIEKNICTGTFGADMQVELINDGPVTIIIDSKNKE